ncbi:hypothetical protein GCM10009534_64040 [Kribbella sandramycini]
MWGTGYPGLTSGHREGRPAQPPTTPKEKIMAEVLDLQILSEDEVAGPVLHTDGSGVSYNC